MKCSESLLMLRVHNETKLFITTEAGFILPIPIKHCDITQEVQTVEVFTLHKLNADIIPVSTTTDIEIVLPSDNYYQTIPDYGILTLALPDSSMTIRYGVVGNYVEHIHGLTTQTLNLQGLGRMLTGSHSPKIYQVRFDLGDGTYRELYAHEQEKDTIIERYYNRSNLWA